MRDYVVCLTCLLFVACAEQAPNKATENSRTSSQDFVSLPSGSNSSDQVFSGNNLQFPQIEGSWNSPCERGAVEYVQRHLRITATTFHQENQFHPDINCANKVKPPFVISGSYEIGNDVVTSNGIVAKQIDFIADSDDTTVRLPDIVYIQNNNMYFGVEQKSNIRPVELDFNFVYRK